MTEYLIGLQDIAFFILTKMFPELEHCAIPAGLN